MVSREPEEKREEVVPLDIKNDRLPANPIFGCRESVSLFFTWLFHKDLAVVLYVNSALRSLHRLSHEVVVCVVFGGIVFGCVDAGNDKFLYALKPVDDVLGNLVVVGI